MFRILVVEDDRELNSQVCEYLQQYGYEMTACLDANEALSVLYNDLYDLVISDMTNILRLNKLENQQIALQKVHRSDQRRLS